MIQSGFSGSLPFTNFYYYTFMLLLAPAKILIYSTFYKDVSYEYLYRIYGHYKYNFSFSLVEYECVMIDSICAIFDWIVVYMPHEMMSFQSPITVIDGKNMSVNAYNCYQVILIYTHLIKLLSCIAYTIVLVFPDNYLVSKVLVFS